MLDPEGLFNPGKIVDPPKMDDRTLFRYKPDYRVADFAPALDWSAWNVDYDPASDVMSAPGTGADAAHDPRRLAGKR